jgi:hypothetical protein
MTNKTDDSPYTRSFNQIELEQIKELKAHYIKANATTVERWNVIRDEAKQIWDEKIISAVDGLRKWSISYDKSSKQVKFVGVQF